MSSQDVRCSIILENLPKLITALTGLTPTNAKFASLEHYALGRIRNHKFMSVNSHEVQRRLDNLDERFAIANYEPYAARLSQLCESFRTNPLCTEHYETDIYWAVMEFMLSVARNPVAGIDQNRGRIALHDEPIRVTTIVSETDALVEDLLKDNYQATAGEEELSDWSDSEGDEDKPVPMAVPAQSNQAIAEEPAVKCSLPGIKPPAKPPYFQAFDGTASGSWLSENLQPAWWLDENYVHPSVSRHPQAQFCHTWLDLASRANNNVASAAPISTISEYCLLREILWLFCEPVTCKMFLVDGDTATIQVAPNVSLNSTSTRALHAALEHFTRYATICMRLNAFCDLVNLGRTNTRAPHSYECYALAVRQLLRPFLQFVHSQELQVAEQRPVAGRPQTLARLQRDMEPYTRLLDNLYAVHVSVTLNFERHPAHICAAYLIGGLLLAHETSSSTCHANVAAALLMGSLRVYMQIIDMWWTDGRLEDWQQEFVIKNIDHAAPVAGGQSFDRTDDFEMRQMSPNAERFVISRSVADTIDACPLVKMLCAHSMQAGYTLNVLHALDRIGEMKSQCGYQENLFATFWNATMEKMQKLQPDDSVLADTTQDSSHAAAKVDTTNRLASEKLQKIDQFRGSLRNGSQSLLALVFEPSLRQMEASVAAETADADDVVSKLEPIDDVYALYEKLERMSAGGLLPIGDAIRSTLSTLLTARISVANRCVIAMFHDEFHVLDHLHNLRRVFLLEASDLMFQFYTKLFRQIERSDSWNNPYLLTDLLNGLLCTKFPDMSSLFTVHVSARRFVSRNVLDALRNVSLSYAVAPCLRDIIDATSLRRYNEVFRLLLRIKWGMWSLEQLRFPLDQRRRRPYAMLTYHDRTFKRLALVRIWILYSMQCVHSHVMTHCVQVMGEQLDKRVAACRTLAELCTEHQRYVHTVHEHCFLQRDDRNILMCVEQLLTLICVVRNEWHNLEDDDAVDSARNSKIDDIESSYINCHAYITNVLNTQRFSKNREHLAGLAAAFSCNRPY